MREHLTRTHFIGCVNEHFRIYADNTNIDVELVQADVLGAHVDGPGRREPFSLIFRGPTQPVLPQRIYRIEHAELGTLEIFLVPIGPDQDSMLYQAVFS